MEATPISGPAFTCTPQSVSLEIEDPTVFVIPTVSAPRFLQYLRAIRVSAVSPDCEMKKQTSSRKIGVFLSKKSEASSSMTGNSVISSISCLVAIQEW